MTLKVRGLLRSAGFSHGRFSASSIPASPRRRKSTTTSSKTEIEISGPNPYAYTAGRWLHGEEERTKSRLIEFDFPTLLDIAVESSPGACKVVKYDKVEGGFNRAFILHLDNGKRLVARVPFHHAGAQGLRTNSEVATISYLREHTSIPLPEVLTWSDSTTNIGSEYIIMEHVPGVQLHQAWPTMNGLQHLRCIQKLCQYMRELTKLSFPAYGSLYFEDVSLPHPEKIPLGGGFCLGPACQPDYYPGTPGEAKNYARRPPNRGPWRDLQSYTQGLVDAGYSRIPDSDVPNLPAYRGTVQQHLQLLERSSATLEELIRHDPIKEISAPMLLHPDFNKRNIFVSESDPQTVTAVIDWQFAATHPIFVYADDTPDFLLPHDTIDNLVTAELGPNATEAAREAKAKSMRERTKILQKVFTTCLQGWMPLLWKARQTDQTLLRLFRYCGTSWRDSAAALRQELIELSEQWTALGLPESCPYQPTKEQLASHVRDFKDFEHVVETRAAIMELLKCDSDGWVPSEVYNVAKELLHETYLEYLKTAREEKEHGLSEDKAAELWPFDSR